MDLLLESFIKKDDMFRRSGQRRCSRPPHRLPDGGKRALALRASFVVGTIAMLTANVVLSATPVGTADNYRTYCASCHGSSLEGAAGPALQGDRFVERWRGRTPALLSLISTSMPYDAPASLTAAQYADITRYIVGRSSLRQPRARAGLSVEMASTPAAEKLGRAKAYGLASTSVPDDRELLGSADGNWLRYNRDYSSQRYSPLSQITAQNVATLVPKCIFQAGEVGNFQSSPVVYAGKMYITTAHNTYALDAANCRKIWKYEYLGGSAPLQVNRGVALYSGMIFRGTLDGHLIALDAETGKLLWDEWVADSRAGYFISAAPTVFDHKVFIGEAGGDYAAAAHVHAFDALSGRHLWSFDTIPKGEQPDAQTWGKGKIPGGCATWTTITVDPATHRLYVPLGNPGLDFDGTARPGINLYSDSVVVIDADSGKLVWYAQQNQHDIHDWDTAAAPVIYDQDGREFMAVGSKDARLYIYDRDNHALIARRDLTARMNDEVPLSSERGVRVCPGVLGGVEWNGPAYDPLDKLLFVNTVDWCTTFKRSKNPSENPQGGTLIFDPLTEARGWLRAFDAATGEARWSYEAGTPMLAGITPTATGLLLTGSGDGDFLIFDAKTGRRLYKFYTGGSIGGGPSTYLVGGRQYIAVASGNSSKSLWQINGAATVVVFGLL
jgi:alcohol dehydrogenase (cytochrome c)